MRSFASYLAVVLIAITQSACSVDIVLHLFNNAEESVQLQVEKKGVEQLEAGMTVKFKNVAHFRVMRGGCVLDYTVPGMPPTEFVENYEMKQHLRLQLEPDNTIVLLRVGDQVPVTPLSYEQPQGYPLVPSKSGICN